MVRVTIPGSGASQGQEDFHVMRKIGVMIVSATLFTSLGLSAAAAQNAQSLAKDRDNRTRQECIQNGGWYQQESGVCEYESKAKAALMDADRKACNHKGAWSQHDTRASEPES